MSDTREAFETAMAETVDYDRVVSICDAHGIGLPVDCVEMVVEIIRLAAPLPRASDAQPTNAEFEVAIETLRAVIDCLRKTGNYSDEEGEATDFLEPLLEARLADQPVAADTGAMTGAARDVLAERQRQMTAEGFTFERDDQYTLRDLAMAGGSYALSGRNTNLYPTGMPPETWPWPSSWWKPEGERRALVKAGALILAEIERIDRASSTDVGETGEAT